jgi:hypothetical protein
MYLFRHPALSSYWSLAGGHTYIVISNGDFYRNQEKSELIVIGIVIVYRNISILSYRKKRFNNYSQTLL